MRRLSVDTGEYRLDSGYSIHGISMNAKRAIQEGRVPANILLDTERLNAWPEEVLSEVLCSTPVEWHHMEGDFKEIDFYSLEDFEDLSEDLEQYFEECLSEAKKQYGL